jgi:hypothetical protein
MKKHPFFNLSTRINCEVYRYDKTNTISVTTISVDRYTNSQVIDIHMMG